MERGIDALGAGADNAGDFVSSAGSVCRGTLSGFSIVGFAVDLTQAMVSTVFDVLPAANQAMGVGVDMKPGIANTVAQAKDEMEDALKSYLEAKEKCCNASDDSTGLVDDDTEGSDRLYKGGDVGGGPVTTGGGSQSGSGTSDGRDQSTGGVEPPDWSRVNEFDRAEIQSSLDWINSELDTCGQLSERDRRPCANATLQHKNKLKGAINRGINSSSSAAERIKWIEQRDRLEATLERNAKSR